MAEAIRRLTGPESVSADLSSPTTLFTVPSKKIYVIRDVTAVARPTAGASSSATPTLLLGKTNVTTSSNVFFGSTLESTAGGYATETASMAIPFSEGEVVVAAVDGLPVATHSEFASSDSGTFAILSATDAASYSTGADDIQTSTFPSNVYFCVINTKATTPDAVSSITDNHSPVRATGITSVSTVATSTIRGSIWAGFAADNPADSATWTVAFANTQTGCAAEGFTFAGSSMALGAPSTSNVILQATTNSGTTETDQSVTQTPTAGDAGFQLLLVGTTGVASTYTGDAGSTEMVDGNYATPATTGAVYIFDPPVTDPGATIASAGTSWVAVCLEIARGGHPVSLTTSGVIIE